MHFFMLKSVTILVEMFKFPFRMTTCVKSDIMLNFLCKSWAVTGSQFKRQIK